ncbi:hypothetical protein [Saccharothrix sp. HUAS TT1]|uniref:hypothetical protein n=1 Tax=unclassified Saccharothrix TaxID=2593673 RepID=UPI00345C3D39
MTQPSRREQGMTDADTHTDWGALVRTTKNLLDDYQTTQAALAQMPPELRAARRGDRVEYLIDDTRLVKTFAARAAIGRGDRVRAAIRFTDGSVAEIRYMTELVVSPTPEAELPACAFFSGSGARCANCRIRRAMHA